MGIIKSSRAAEEKESHHLPCIWKCEEASHVLEELERKTLILEH